MQGIILPATRLLEPYYNRVFVRTVKKYLRAITFSANEADLRSYHLLNTDADEEDGIEPIDFFLNSILNIEMVYVIL